MLNDKQKRFCEEYVIDLNATQSAIRAGYSEKTAGSIGNNLLKKVEIQNEINDINNKRSAKTGITSERVLTELGKIAFSDLKEYLSFDENGVQFKDSEEVDGTLISEVSSQETVTRRGSGDSKEETIRVNLKMKLHDKMKALELLGKHLNIFNEANSGFSENELSALKQEAQRLIESNI